MTADDRYESGPGDCICGTEEIDNTCPEHGAGGRLREAMLRGAGPMPSATSEVFQNGECMRDCDALGVPCPNRCLHWMKQDARRIGCAYCAAEAAAAKAAVAKVQAARSSGAAPEPERLWGYGDSRHTEVWTGACDSREEAIEEARESYTTESFWIVSGTRPDPAAWCPDVAAIVQERVEENAYDNAGEIAEDWPDPVSKEACEELNAFAKAWVRKYMRPTFWIADGNDHEEIPGTPASPFTRPAVKP